MNKGVGFNRNIYLPLLDATAAFCTEIAEPAEIRSRVESVVAQEVSGIEGRRKTSDILMNIWVRTEGVSPSLRAEAVRHYRTSVATTDRLWLHFGLTTLYYPFFRKTAAAIGQLGRNQELITPAMVKARLAADFGQLGSLGRAVEYVMFSLRNWGLMANSDKRYAYVLRRQLLTASNIDLESWMLACALYAHPAEEMAFADLLRLPELFPFRFSLSVDQLRQSKRFAVQRQGMGWDMVRLEGSDA